MVDAPNCGGGSSQRVKRALKKATYEILGDECSLTQIIGYRRKMNTNK